MNPSESKSVVQEFYDQWNSGAIDFDRVVREEVTNHQPDREPAGSMVPRRPTGLVTPAL